MLPSKINTPIKNCYMQKIYLQNMQINMLKSYYILLLLYLILILCHIIYYIYFTVTLFLSFKVLSLTVPKFHGFLLYHSNKMDN